MKKKVKDRHLDLPSEANRDKHINFVALERDEEDPADSKASGKLADKNPDVTKHNNRKKDNQH